MNDEELLKAYKVGRNIRMVKLSGLQALELMAQARIAALESDEQVKNWIEQETKELKTQLAEAKKELKHYKQIHEIHLRMIDNHKKDIAQARQQALTDFKNLLADKLHEKHGRISNDLGSVIVEVHRELAKHTEGK